MEHRNAHYSSGRSQLIEYFVVWQWQCATQQKVAEWKITAVQCGSRKGQHADELPNGSLSNLPPPNVVDLPLFSAIFRKAWIQIWHLNISFPRGPKQEEMRNFPTINLANCLLRTAIAIMSHWCHIFTWFSVNSLKKWLLLHLVSHLKRAKGQPPVSSPAVPKISSKHQIATDWLIIKIAHLRFPLVRKLKNQVKKSFCNWEIQQLSFVHFGQINHNF